MIMVVHRWQACAVLACAVLASTTTAFVPTKLQKQLQSPSSSCQYLTKPAGAFFNQVPEDDGSKADRKKEDTQLDIDQSLKKLMQQRKAPSLASQPSTINGIPTSLAGVGFGKPKAATAPKKKQTYIGIGEPDKPVNDVTKPEYDDQGYTLYTDEETGEKARVFKALVEYPCDFTLKIVGANEGTFVEEILQVVAESCEVADATGIKHSTRTMGKWTSVTVQAPVKSAEMLYQLYENVDRDPRVKFKF